MKKKFFLALTIVAIVGLAGCQSEMANDASLPTQIQRVTEAPLVEEQDSMPVEQPATTEREETTPSPTGEEQVQITVVPEITEVPEEISNLFIYTFCDGENTIRIDYVDAYALEELGIDKLEIPEFLDGLQVTEIGSYAFRDCFNDLTSVQLPDSVITIDEGAFFGCGLLTNIELSDSLTNIGIYAFAECVGLTNIKLPNSVMNIGEGAFDGCENLIHVDVVENSYAEEWAINNGYILPKEIPVTDASNFAFEQKEDGTLTITRIKDSSLRAVVIPDEIYGFAVTEIEARVFHECKKLVHVELPDSLRGEIRLSVPSTVTTLKLPENEHITKVDIWNYAGKSIDIPCSVEYLRLDCPNLEEVIIPSSVKELYITSEKIEDISVPDSVTTLILNCSNLNNVTMGKNISVLKISSEKIESIQVPDNITQLVLYCNNLINIDVPETVSQFFLESEKIESISIPSGVTDLMLYCSNLESLIIPENVESINLECDNLKEIHILGTVSDLDLRQCYNIRKIVFQKEMNFETLDLCNLKFLESIDIPKGIKKVYLSGCSSLKTITLPEGITEVNLNDCKSLTSVGIPDGVTSLNMRGCTSLTSVDIPYGVTYANLQDCTNLTDIVLVSSLGTYESNKWGYSWYEFHAHFSGCSNLTTITIPFTLYYDNFKDCFKDCPKVAVIITNDSTVTNWAVSKGYSVLKYVSED